MKIGTHRTLTSDTSNGQDPGCALDIAVPANAEQARESWMAGAVRCLLLGTGCLLAAGCGSSGPEVVPVRGKVSFGGAEWPKPGALHFTPIEPAPGLPRRPGMGQFDTDGSFTVTTFTEGDGLIPGHYKVAVECWEVPPQMNPSASTRSYVPVKCQSPMTSDLEVTIETGSGAVTLRFDVPRQ